MDWRVPCFSRIEQAFAEGGLPCVVRLACCKLISPWIESGYIEFYSCNFGEGIPNCVSNVDLSVRQAGLDDMRTLLEAYDLSRSEEKISKRFREGDHCFIATNDRGEGVHVSWISTRLVSVPKLNLRLLLAPGEIYNYDTYTRRDMRRRGIDSAARSLTYRHLREVGHHKLYLYVRGENLAGRRAARRLLDPAGTVRYWRSLRSGQILYPHYDMQSGIFAEFLGKIRTPERGSERGVSKTLQHIEHH